MRGRSRLNRRGPAPRFLPVPLLLTVLMAGAAGCTPDPEPTDPANPSTPASPSVSSSPPAPTTPASPETPAPGDPDDIRAATDPLIRDAQQAAEAGVGPVEWSSTEPELTADTTPDGACAVRAEVAGEGAPPKDYDLDALLPNLNEALAAHDFSEASDFDYAGGWVLLDSTDAHDASFEFRAKGRVEISITLPAQCPE
ncbi:MAG: hypothetical protein ACTH2Q_20665 [Propionibacteriaceae bacterium]